MSALVRWKHRQRSRLIFVHIPVPGVTITAKGLTQTRRFHGAFMPDPRRPGFF